MPELLSDSNILYNKTIRYTVVFVMDVVQPLQLSQVALFVSLMKAATYA